MRFIINKIKGNLAICEKSDQTMVNLELEQMPDGVKEGDILIEKDGHYELDLTESEKRKVRVQSLMDDLTE